MNNKPLKFIFAALTLSFALTGSARELLVPSGLLNNIDKILKYDLATGAYSGDFASATDDFGAADNGKGILENPTNISMGPDGKVYVSFTETWNSGNKGGVARFLADGTYDSLVVDFDNSNPGDQVVSTTGVTFGSDGLMYIGYDSGVKQYTRDGTFQGDIFTDNTGGGSQRDVQSHGDKIYFQSKDGDGGLNFYDVNAGTVTGTGQNTDGFLLGMASDGVNDRFYALGHPNDGDGDQDVARWQTPTGGSYNASFFDFTNNTGTPALGLLYDNDLIYVHDGGDGDILLFDATTGNPATGPGGSGFFVEDDQANGLTGSAWGMVIIPEPSTLALLLLLIPAVFFTRKVHS